MAKVLFGGGVAEMRRSLEGNTFSRNKGGSYVRQRVRPINPNTPDQINKRQQLSLLSKAWGAELTQVQRDGWTAFAEINTIIDVLGQVLQLSGIQMYIRVNARLLIAGETRIDDAPLNQDVTQVSIVSVVFDVTGISPEYTIEFTPPIALGEGIQTFSTPQLSPGISFIKNRTRLIEPFLSGATTPLAELTNWQAKFGTLPVVGSKVVTELRVLRTSNGAVSVPTREDTIVV